MEREEGHSMDGELRYGQPGLERLEALPRAGAAPALFSYAATPNPVPYTTDSKNPSVVTLMLAVVNTSGKNQQCSEIVFKLPMEGGGALTRKPDTIKPSPALGTKWTITSDGCGTLTATPRTTAPFRAGDSIAFILEDVEVADAPAASVIAVSERTDALRQGWCLVSKTPPGLAITRLTATPIQILAGEQTTLTWTTTGATGCTLAGEGPPEDVQPNDSKPVSPKRQVTYTLTASGKGPPAIQQITVVVPEVRIVGFRASEPQIAQGGTSALSWEVLNAKACFLEPGHIPVNASEGKFDVTPEKTTQYTLQAYGYGIDTKSEPTWVNVMPVSIGHFAVSPERIPPGAPVPVTLDWTVDFASRRTIDPDGSAVPPSGSKVVTNRVNAWYTLRAEGLEPKEQVRAIQVWPALTGFDIFCTGPGTLANQVQVTWASRSDGLKLRLANETRAVAANGEVTLPLTKSGGPTIRLALLLPGSEAHPLLELDLEGFKTMLNRGFCPSTSLTSIRADGLTTPGATIRIDWMSAGNVRGKIENGKGASETITTNFGDRQLFVDQDLPFGFPHPLWQGTLTTDFEGHRWAMRWRAYCPITGQATSE